MSPLRSTQQWSIPISTVMSSAVSTTISTQEFCLFLDFLLLLLQFQKVTQLPSSASCTSKFKTFSSKNRISFTLPADLRHHSGITLSLTLPPSPRPRSRLAPLIPSGPCPLSRCLRHLPVASTRNSRPHPPDAEMILRTIKSSTFRIFFFF